MMYSRQGLKELFLPGFVATVGKENYEKTLPEFETIITDAMSRAKAGFEWKKWTIEEIEKLRPRK